jgi:Transposase DDE domain
LPQRVHEELIIKTIGNEIISHNSRDSTAITAREKIQKSEDPKSDDIAANVKKQKKKKRGRPKKGEERQAPEPTRVEKQLKMSLDEMLEDLPKGCNKGAKKDSKGNTMYWNGYKLHLDTVDGGIPVSAILTSASVNDSQVAIPLATLTKSRITNLYDLMDAAYDVPAIIEHSKSLNHVPLIDKNPRRDKGLQEFIKSEAKARKILNLPPAEDVRYNERSTAERANARLKDEFGARKVRVKGHMKVCCHLMFGVLVLAADQLMRIVT